MGAPTPTVSSAAPRSWRFKVSVFLVTGFVSWFLFSGDRFGDLNSVAFVRWVTSLVQAEDAPAADPSGAALENGAGPAPEAGAVPNGSTETAPAPTSAADSTSSSLGAVDLGSAGGMPATAYFGESGAVSAAAPGIALPSVDPQRCALTVVFRDVSGTEAAVWASFDYIGQHWPALEGAPNLSVPESGGVMHHQVLSPPPGVAPTYTIRSGGHLEIDAGRQIVDSSRFDLQLESVDGSTQNWLLNDGQKVHCTI